jgi:WD40 repeat protein
MRKIVLPAVAAGALLVAIVQVAVFGALRSGASSGAGSGTGSAGTPFVRPLAQVSAAASTIPAGGDLNPQGTAVVPDSHGNLTAGDVLVSNFSDADNHQGLGRTIVEISPHGQQRLFAKIPAGSVPDGSGLTTALVVLRSGWVIVGSLPAADGTSAAMQPGELLVLDSAGHVRKTITGHGIVGPSGATVLDSGNVADLFVSNALDGITNGQPSATTSGDVVRLKLVLTGSEPELAASTVIGNGLPVHTDPSALTAGPAGVALSRDGTLFVADAAASRIARIPNAVLRTTTFNAGAAGATASAGQHLNGPLGLAFAPDGDLLAVNGGDNNLVELTTAGTQVATRDLDTDGPVGGVLSGLAATADPRAVYFVNDDTNTLSVLR